MRINFLLHLLPGIIALASPAWLYASLGYKVKTEGAVLYRSEKLEPPPVGSLGQGQAVMLIHQGTVGSHILIEGGVTGWVRNEDLLAIENEPGRIMRFGAQHVVGSAEFDLSPFFTGYYSNILPLDRNYSLEFLETMDREQIEGNHGEN
jgi:hypothetical protein